ncbi:MAG: DMT family transporter [bacterium]
MTWLYIALIAHFLFAIVFILDKFLLSKISISPIAYVFYTGILQILVLFLIPFGFALIPFKQVIISFISGALFVFAVYIAYKAIQIGEVSKITPIIGGGNAIFTLILTYLFLAERLSFYQFISFFLLVFGGMIMIWPKKDSSNKGSFNALAIAILSAFLFAISFVLTKIIFNYQPFVNGFIWTRLGGVLGALIILFWPGNFRKILKTTKEIRLKTGCFLISNKALSAIAFILLNYAIFLGSVSLVNALQGVQYAFLFIVAIIISVKFPQILKEQISQGVILQKIMAILLICFGLGLLAF